MRHALAATAVLLGCGHGQEAVRAGGGEQLGGLGADDRQGDPREVLQVGGCSQVDREHRAGSRGRAQTAAEDHVDQDLREAARESDEILRVLSVLKKLGHPVVAMTSSSRTGGSGSGSTGGST
mgnify:CR=1 FL=1